MTAKASLGRIEFVALMAMLTATVAFSIDAMLPALPAIAQALTPDAPNHAQLVVSAFIFGLGVGTFIVGPLSDSFGRKPVVVVGAAIYILSAIMAMLTQSLWMLVIARAAQGLGASAPRVIALAIIRDLYKGREMARLMSFVMMVFTLVPAIAPLAGSAIIALAGWHGIFASFLLFSALSVGWMMIRLAEPLPRTERTAFQPQALWGAAREVVSIASVRISILVQTLCFTALFASISSIQQIIGAGFGRADQFPYWFAMIALIAGSGSLINAALVVRLGMRRMISFALVGQLIISLLAIGLLQFSLPQTAQFAIYIIWQTTVFLQISLTVGNLTSLAMEPLGHIAGTAASVISGLATVGSVLLTVPIGLAFDGTALPLIGSVILCMGVGRYLMTFLPETNAR